MSKNRPYEQDSGILSTVLGTTALAGIGYASYVGINDPDAFEQATAKVFNKVFPVVSDTPNAYQSRRLGAYNALASMDPMSEGRRHATFQARRNEVSEMVKAVNKSIADGSHIYNPIGNTSYHNFGYDLAELNKAGSEWGVEAIGDKIKAAISNLTGSLQTSVDFSGTTMNVTTAGTTFNVHLPKWDEAAGVFLSRENGSTLRVHKLGEAFIEKAEDGKIGIKSFRDPLTNVLKVLENPMELLYHANKGMDQGRDSKEIWRHIDKKKYNNLKSHKQKLAEISRVAKELGYTNYETEIGHRGIQEVLDSITRDTSQWIPENDTIQREYFGKQVKVNDWSMVLSEDDSAVIQLGKINSMTTNADEIRAIYDQIPARLREFVKTSPVNKVQHVFANADLGWITNQTQIAERVMGTSPSVQAFQTAEMFKARARGYEGIFDEARKRTVFGRVAPIIQNPTANAQMPALLNNNLQTLGLIGVVDPTISGEMAYLNPRLRGTLTSAKTHTYTINSLATSNDLTKVDTSVEAIIKGIQGPKSYTSLHEFLEAAKTDHTLLRNVQSLKMKAGTVVGLGPGLDQIEGIDHLSLAREIAELGSPVRTQDVFEMGRDDIGRLVDSWNWHNETKGTSKIKVTGKLIADTTKAGDAAVDWRYNVIYGRTDESFAGGIKKVMEDTRIRFNQQQAKARSILERLEFEADKAKMFAYDLEHNGGVINETLVKKHKYMTRAINRIKSISSRIAPAEVDARIAFDMFKHTIPRNVGGSLTMGKGGASYLSFLQYAFLGHIGGKSQKLSGEALTALETVSSYEASRGAISGFDLIRDKSFFFNQHKGVNGHIENVGKQIEAMERLLATSMYHGHGKEVGNLIPLEQARDRLSLKFNALKNFGKGEKINWGGVEHASDDLVKGDNAFYFYHQLFPHENEVMTQGKGYNIFRVGIKEMQIFEDMPGVLANMHLFNSVDTLNIMRQGQFLEKSMSMTGENKASYAEMGAKILETDEDFLSLGAEGVMEHAFTSKNALQRPDVITQTMFGSNEYHRNGVGVRYLNEKGEMGLAYVGGGSFQGVNQYLGEKDLVTLTRTNHASYDLIKAAYRNGGVARHQDAEKYFKAMLQEHGQGTKGGYQKYGALHVELTAYSRNLQDHDVLGNEKLMKKLEGAGEEAARLRQMTGNTLYVNKDIYRQTLEKQIEEIGMAADFIKANKMEEYEKIFGASSQITKMLKEGKDAQYISRKLADESVETASKFTKLMGKLKRAKLVEGRFGDTEMQYIKELTELLSTKTNMAVAIRHPILFKGSGVAAYMMAADEKTIGHGKALMAGDLLNSLMKADFDGDKIAVIMDFMEGNRKEMVARIEGVQKWSSNVLNHISNKETIKPAGSWESDLGEAYSAVGPDAEMAAKAMKTIGEHDSVLASYMTKGLTGSADVYTHGIISDILKNAKGRMNPEQMSEFSSAIGTFVPWNIVQQSISSKHLERIINGDNYTRLEKMLGNIGSDVARDAIHANIRDNQGALTMLDIFSLADKTNAKWADAGLEHYNTLFQSHFNLAPVDEGRFTSALQYVGYEEAAAKRLWDARAAKMASMDPELAKPLSEKIGSFEQFGEALSLKHYITPIRKGVREQPSMYNLLKDYYASLDKKNVSTLDALKGAFDVIQSSQGYKTAEAIETLTGNVGLRSRRSLVGLEATMNMVKNHIVNHPGRMAGLAGLAIVGVTAVNMLFGDGTPMNPNDLPSVNNPSFRDNRYNTMLENRHLNNAPNANMSTGLLTDSYNSYDSIMNHLQSNFGSHYSSVSVRHDGQDPYKQHMMQYNS